MKPGSRPQLSREDVITQLSLYHLVDYPVKLLGIRGYYRDTMGAPGKNDIGIYDDAIFVESPDSFKSYNANTDPSRIFPKVAILKPGGPYLYKVGMHNMKNPYEALRQYGTVTVLRDGIPVSDSPGRRFYIDIHRGGYGTTSSLGCQTIHPDQWPGFMRDIKQALKKNNQTIIPYILIDNEKK